MPTIDDIIPEHEAQGRRQRQNVDSELESLRSGLAGPGRNQSGGHEGHATGGIRDEGEEGGKTPHQHEHGIRPSAWEVHCSIPGSLYTARLSSLAVNDRTWAFE